MLDLLVILVLLLLVFGSGKLRSIGSDLGTAVKGFKKALAHGPAEQRPGQAARRPEQAQSTPPDAEFPEVTLRRQSERDGA